MTYTSLPKKFFANQTLAIYGDHSGGTIRTLPIYKPFTINLSYVNGVSVPAEESQYRYIYTTLIND